MLVFSCPGANTHAPQKVRLEAGWDGWPLASRAYIKSHSQLVSLEFLANQHPINRLISFLHCRIKGRVSGEQQHSPCRGCDCDCSIQRKGFSELDPVKMVCLRRPPRHFQSHACRSRRILAPRICQRRPQITSVWPHQRK